MTQQKQPKALIIDDDPLQTEIMALILMKYGITPEVVNSSKAFLKRLEEMKPSICFVDLNIESLGSGFRLIKTIRQDGADQPVIVVVSMVSDQKAIAHSIEIGANDYLIKPVEPSLLASKISRYFSAEPIAHSRPASYHVPRDFTGAEIEVDLEVQEIQENGLITTGRHLLPKGLVISFTGDFVSQITEKTGFLNLTVVSTWIEEESGEFAAYMAFDATNESLMASVKRWLASNSKLSRGK